MRPPARDRQAATDCGGWPAGHNSAVVAEDVSHVIAQEILRRLGLEGRNVPSELEDFIDRHVGRDRQLTPRLAY